MARRITPHEKAAKTKRLKKKPVRKKGKGGSKTRSKAEVVFLPDCPEQVRAIAMTGATDDEMAVLFGISPKLIQRWKEFYPKFEKAIEEGRTMADAQVIEALHKKAIGFTRTKDIVVPVGRGKERHMEVLTVTEPVDPETNAIKFWLTNRNPEAWSERRHVSLGGKKGEPPVGFKSETKMELMSSILSLVSPKPDGE